MASISKRITAKGETRYDVRWRVHGKARERAFTKRSLAETFKRKIDSEQLAGIIIDPRAGDITFSEYAELWIQERTIKGRALAPMTLQGYRGLLRRILEPTFGDARLRRIGPEEVRAWYVRRSSS